MEGDFGLRRGVFDVFLRGRRQGRVKAGDKARLVALGVERNTWCNDTIKDIDVAINLGTKHLELLHL